MTILKFLYCLMLAVILFQMLFVEKTKRVRRNLKSIQLLSILVSASILFCMNVNAASDFRTLVTRSEVNMTNTIALVIFICLFVLAEISKIINCTNTRSIPA